MEVSMQFWIASYYSCYQNLVQSVQNQLSCFRLIMYIIGLFLMSVIFMKSCSMRVESNAISITPSNYWWSRVLKCGLSYVFQFGV